MLKQQTETTTIVTTRPASLTKPKLEGGGGGYNGNDSPGGGSDGIGCSCGCLGILGFFSFFIFKGENIFSIAGKEQFAIGTVANIALFLVVSLRPPNLQSRSWARLLVLAVIVFNMALGLRESHIASGAIKDPSRVEDSYWAIANVVLSLVIAINELRKKD